MKVFGIAGRSGMGKTSLLERLIPRLVGQGLRVSLLKHSHKDIEVDRPGKDSFRLREAGCQDVLLLGSRRWALMHELRSDAEPPLAELLAFKARMGWKFDWASSHGSDFNRDFHVSFEPEDRVDGEVFYNFHMTPFPQTEAPGISVFCKDDAGQVFHTYSTFGRGVEVMMGTYPLVDLTPRGRDEAGLSYTMAWVRHHDRYEDAPAGAACCGGAAG